MANFKAVVNEAHIAKLVPMAIQLLFLIVIVLSAYYLVPFAFRDPTPIPWGSFGGMVTKGFLVIFCVPLVAISIAIVVKLFSAYKRVQSNSKIQTDIGKA